MKAEKKKFSCILALLLIALAGCAKSPTVYEHWMDETYKGKQYEKILIIGVADKVTGRSLFEGEVARQLQSRGVEAVRSYTILPDQEMLTKEIILNVVREFNIDGVLFTFVTDRRNRTVYYQDADLYTNYNHVMNVGNVGAISSYDIEVLSLITNFYDVKSEGRIWTVDYDFERRGLKSFNLAIKFVIDTLQEDGFI